MVGWIKQLVYFHLLCSGQHGFVVAITGVENIGKGLIHNGTGFVTFLVKYQCVVFTPFKGEILEAVVTMVNKKILSYLVNVNGEAEELESPVDEGGGDHEVRVKGADDDPAEGVLALGVEPVPEVVEALLGQVKGSAVIEIGIELVDHGLVAKDAEEAHNEGEDVD
ncbi:uncharacterized protein LOC110760526 [Prunus avium]|uniref:DNA-directed RNA polymerase subunit n=1 Tax=Prunus avium TaxID=42229 RepID=A0A6P5SQT1_PRUAV|nr:uncharacterized protein LOC110760526 [Prunus avium]